MRLEKSEENKDFNSTKVCLSFHVPLPQPPRLENHKEQLFGKYAT